MIYYYEIKNHLKSTIIFIFTLTSLITFFLLNTKTQPSGVNELIKELPKILQIILGVGTFDTTTIVGNFLHIYPYILIAIFGYIIYLSTEITATHEEINIERIIPIAKWKVILMKLLGVLTIGLFLILVTISLSMVILFIKGETELTFMVYIFINSACSILLFSVIGLMIGLIPINSTLTTTISLLLILITYLFYLLANSSESSILAYFPLSVCINAQLLANNFNYFYTIFVSCFSLILISIILYKEK